MGGQTIYGGRVEEVEAIRRCQNGEVEAFGLTAASEILAYGTAVVIE